MKNKILLLVTLILSTVFVFGQNQQQAMKFLKKIKKTVQVEKYKNKRKYSGWQIRIVKTMGIDSVKYPGYSGDTDPHSGHIDPPEVLFQRTDFV